MTTQSSPISPLRWALAAGAALTVFLLITVTTTLVTFILPESYASTARIQLHDGNRPATNVMEQLGLIRSEEVLTKVISNLDLARQWAKKYGGDRLPDPAVLMILRQQVQVQLVRGTSLAEIRVMSESREEAASIANQIASVYCATASTNGAQVVDKAEPGLRPVRPNKPLNILLGAATGSIAGGLVAAAVLLIGRKRRQIPEP